MNEEQLASMQAYALGYYHGRAQGVSNWCGEIYNDDEYVWYVEGYAKGVADYFEDVGDPANNRYVHHPKSPRIAFAAPRSLEKATARELLERAIEEWDSHHEYYEFDRVMGKIRNYPVQPDVTDKARELLERVIEEWNTGHELDELSKVMDEIRTYLAQPDVEC